MHHDSSTRSPDTTSADDPVLQAEVEHAVAPYRSLLPPEMFEVLRQTITQGYLEHPQGRRLLEAIRSDVSSINESGERSEIEALRRNPAAVAAAEAAMKRGR